jgi:hypothetical protein
LIGEGDGRVVATPFALLLFTVFLPALNAPFDWVSLAISRHLIRWTASAGSHWLASLANEFARLVVILVDFAIAVMLSIVIVAATAGGVALFNLVHLEAGGAGMGFTVSERLAAIRADPADPQFWWIYVMIFSTLLPTLLHIFVVAGAWGYVVVGRFTPFLKWLADKAEAAEQRFIPALAPAAAFAALRVAFGVLPFFMFRSVAAASLLIWIASRFGWAIDPARLIADFGVFLLDLAECVAQMLGQ